MFQDIYFRENIFDVVPDIAYNEEYNYDEKMKLISEKYPKELIMHLINKNASLEIKNVEKVNILQYCLKNSNMDFELFEYLIEKKADVNNVSIGKEDTLHFACSSPNISIPIIDYLVTKLFFDVNSFKIQKTPFFYLCRNFNVRLEHIQYFIHKKAFINSASSSSPICALLQTGNCDLIEYLILQKADINIETSKFSGYNNNAGFSKLLLHDIVSKNDIKILFTFLSYSILTESKYNVKIIFLFFDFFIFFIFIFIFIIFI